MKIIKLLLFLILFFVVVGCRENIIDFKDETATGKLFISSFPSGAEIFLEDNSTGKFTPDSLTSLQPGYYTLRLHLLGYSDETVSVKIVAGLTRYVNISFSE